MEKYKILEKIGSGSYGTVWKAINKHSGDVVAIKKLKKQYFSWEECLNLREVRFLPKLDHPNIVKLQEIIKEHNILYLVFEYMDCNLYQLMKAKQFYGFSESEIKNWCFQLFQGLAYMHESGYFHRDLKPENLLINQDNVLKIADFGLAREITSGPPYTQYMTTRWYRAPEVLLHSNTYSPKVDMWAMGAIIAQFFTIVPLFPGVNQADQMFKICKLIGSPSEDSWPEGVKLAKAINYQFPRFNDGVPLSVLLPSASEDAISLIGSLLSWDPCKRPTAMEALQHPFFSGCYAIPPHLHFIHAMESKSKLVSSDYTCPRSEIFLTTGIPCKRELIEEDANDDEDLLKGEIYIPPAKGGHRTDYGVIGRKKQQVLQNFEKQQLGDENEDLLKGEIYVAPVNGSRRIDLGVIGRRKQQPLCEGLRHHNLRTRVLVQPNRMDKKIL